MSAVRLLALAVGPLAVAMPATAASWLCVAPATSLSLAASGAAAWAGPAAAVVRALGLPAVEVGGAAADAATCRRRDAAGTWQRFEPPEPPPLCRRSGGRPWLWGAVGAAELPAVAADLNLAVPPGLWPALAYLPTPLGSGEVVVWSALPAGRGPRLELWWRPTPTTQIGCPPPPPPPLWASPSPAVAAERPQLAVRLSPAAAWAQACDAYSKQAPLQAALAAIQLAALQDAHSQSIDTALGAAPVTWRGTWSAQHGWLGCLPLAQGPAALAMLADLLEQAVGLWPQAGWGFEKQGQQLQGRRSGVTAPAWVLAAEPRRWLAASDAKALPSAVRLACGMALAPAHPRAKAEPKLRVQASHPARGLPSWPGQLGAWTLLGEVDAQQLRLSAQGPATRLRPPAQEK